MSGFQKLSLFKDSPFGAPAPKSSDSDSENEEDFFSRSKLTYARIAADEEDRKKRKAEQASIAKEESTPVTPPSQKKQKTSPSHEEPPTTISSRQGSEESAESQTSPPDYRAQSRSHEIDAVTSPNVTAASAAHEVIDLDDGSDASVEEVGASQLPVTEPSTDPRTGRRSEQAESGQENPEETAGTSESAALPLIQETSAAPDPGANMVVSILITSNLPGCSALIVQRKLGQRLKEPRLEYCKRQGLDAVKTADVILTWRGKQVYDSTTCRALGIGVDSSGNIVGVGEEDTIGDTDRRIHMVATTREMLRELRVAKTNPLNGPEDNVAVPASQPTGPTEAKVRVILKSREREDLKLMVKETHLISRLINAFRKEYSVDPATTVSIYFDGEELDSEQMIKDSDISDMDTLDVHEKV